MTMFPAGAVLCMSRQRIEQEVVDYVSVNFDPSEWDIEGIVEEIHDLGFDTVDDMDQDTFTEILQRHDLG